MGKLMMGLEMLMVMGGLVFLGVFWVWRQIASATNKSLDYVSNTMAFRYVDDTATKHVMDCMHKARTYLNNREEAKLPEEQVLEMKQEKRA